MGIAADSSNSAPVISTRGNLFRRTVRRAGRIIFRRKRKIPVGKVRLGDLGRLEPFCSEFGYSRGAPVDRYYIENFLEANSSDIMGRVLEVADPSYTRRFGGNRVDRADVLHAAPGNDDATIVSDLSKGEGIDSGVYDAVILTQTLLCIYDVRGAVENLFRILRPNGVALVTLPGVCKIAREDYRNWGDFWRFTDLSARRLFEEFFPAANVEVQTFGNVLAATALLYGLSCQELSREQLDHFDEDYQVTIAVRAVKPK